MRGDRVNRESSQGEAINLIKYRLTTMRYDLTGYSMHYIKRNHRSSIELCPCDRVTCTSNGRGRSGSNRSIIIFTDSLTASHFYREHETVNSTERMRKAYLELYLTWQVNARWTRVHRGLCECQSMACVVPSRTEITGDIRSLRSLRLSTCDGTCVPATCHCFE